MYVTADSLCPGDLRKYFSHLEIVFGVDISGLQVRHDVHDGTRADAMPPRTQALPREDIPVQCPCQQQAREVVEGAGGCMHACIETHMHEFSS